MAPQDFLARLPPERMRLAPVGPRSAPLFGFGLLTAACALASFAFACATPFAAFAVIAADMLPMSSALLVTAAAWLVNQAIGFGYLHYPLDASTISWGFVIGAAALGATVAAIAVLRFMQRSGTVVAMTAALIGAYVAYELILFAATPFLGGEGAFITAIVGRIGALNMLWLIGLVAACATVRLLNPYRRRQTAS